MVLLSIAHKQHRIYLTQIYQVVFLQNMRGALPEIPPTYSLRTMVVLETSERYAATTEMRFACKRRRMIPLARHHRCMPSSPPPFCQRGQEFQNVHHVR